MAQESTFCDNDIHFVHVVTIGVSLKIKVWWHMHIWRRLRYEVFVQTFAADITELYNAGLDFYYSTNEISQNPLYPLKVIAHILAWTVSIKQMR